MKAISRTPLWRLCAPVVCIAIVGCGSPGTGPAGPGAEVGPQAPVGPIGEQEGVAGSENITTEMRDIGPFDRLVFDSEGDVRVTTSVDPSLSITADDNLHQYIEVVVDSSVLTISTTANTDIAPSRPIEVEVGASGLSVLELRGAGAITVESLGGSIVSLIHAGAGDIDIGELRADRVTIDHAGVGTITVSGEVDEQRTAVSGVGEFDGADLMSRTATVDASGLGTMTIWVTEELSVAVSDSGTVAFYGAPDVDQSVSDAGSITALGDK